MTTRSTASDDDQPQVIANRTQRRASVGFALFAVLEAWILFLDHTFGGYVFFAAGLLLFFVPRSAVVEQSDRARQ
jgi:hypothetical protein